MDWVFARAVSHYSPVLKALPNPYLLLSYDVICGWSVNWPSRVAGNPVLANLIHPLGLTIWRSIGSWHIHGHDQKCSARYGFRFAYGAGAQDGEGCEVMWSGTNAVASTARAMSYGGRIEVLDDKINHWNLNKLTNAGEQTTSAPPLRF